jgi:hypothetical protein
MKIAAVLLAPAARHSRLHLQDSLRTFHAQHVRQQVARKMPAGERVLVVLDHSPLPAPAAS